MKTFVPVWASLFALVCACSDDDNNGSARCDDIARQITAVAEHDDDLLDYQGEDRRANPCAEPIPITSNTDYRPACEELEGCPNELKQR